MTDERTRSAALKAAIDSQRARASIEADLAAAEQRPFQLSRKDPPRRERSKPIGWLRYLGSRILKYALIMLGLAIGASFIEGSGRFLFADVANHLTLKLMSWRETAEQFVSKNVTDGPDVQPGTVVLSRIRYKTSELGNNPAIQYLTGLSIAGATIHMVSSAYEYYYGELNRTDPGAEVVHKKLDEFPATAIEPLYYDDGRIFTVKGGDGHYIGFLVHYMKDDRPFCVAGFMRKDDFDKTPLATTLKKSLPIKSPAPTR